MKGICGFCGKKGDVKNKVQSVFHEHNNASGICREVKFVGHFEFVDGTGRPKLCLGCQGTDIRGMATGGNWG